MKVKKMKKFKKKINFILNKRRIKNSLYKIMVIRNINKKILYLGKKFLKIEFKRKNLDLV